MANMVDRLGRLMADIHDGMSENVSPEFVWRNVYNKDIFLARQIAAYETPEDMACELRDIAKEKNYTALSGQLNDIANMICKDRYDWAKEFVACATKEAKDAQLAYGALKEKIVKNGEAVCGCFPKIEGDGSEEK